MTGRIVTSAVHALGSGLLYRLRDERGTCGIGEASPLPGYSPDDLPSVRAALTALSVADFTGADPLGEIATIVSAIDPALPAARCAAETALLDLCAQRLDLPVWRLLRGDDDADPLPIAVSTLIASLADARAAHARGMTTVKLKLGRQPFAADLDLLLRLRAEFGAALTLRLDVNQLWSPAQARDHLAALVPIAPEYVEEPVAGADLAALDPCPMAIAVDESLAGDEAIDMVELASHGVVALVLKPMLLGGVVACMNLATRARRIGLAPVVGHMFGGPIALAVTTELATALAPRRACAIDHHIGLRDWPALPVPRRGPSRSPNPHPGLGLTSRLSLLAAARAHPQRTALVVAGRSYSFAELVAPVQNTMAWLSAQRIKGHSRVAVVANMSFDTAIALYALFELGCPAILIDPRLPATRRAQMLDPLAPDLVLGAAWRVPSAAGAAAAPALIDDDQVAAIVFTSASTGASKAVELSRAAFVASADASASNLGWRDDDRWLACLPLAHIGGLAILVRGLVGRRTVVLSAGERFTAALLSAEIEATRTTLLSLVPTMLSSLLAAGWTGPAHLRAVLLGGAAAPDVTIATAIARGIPVLVSYGMTETCAQVATQRLATPALRRVGVGPALPGCELRIGDDDAIWVRGPSLFSGYADGNCPLDGDGWFDTGDSGYLDADGNLHVRGRSDDTIVTGGENVHPAEVEAALIRHPAITAACVFAIADPHWGEIIAAAVVAANPAAIDGLGDFLHDQLASYQRPRRLCRLDHLPLAANGKIDRSMVTAMATPRLLPLPRATIAGRG